MKQKQRNLQLKMDLSMFIESVYLFIVKTIE